MLIVISNSLFLCCYFALTAYRSLPVARPGRPQCVRAQCLISSTRVQLALIAEQDFFLPRHLIMALCGGAIAAITG